MPIQLSPSFFRRLRTFAAVATCVAATTGPLAASGGERVPFEDLLTRSQLIFQGVVTAIEFRNSDPALDGGRKLPHTFVTFAVERTLKSRPQDGDRVTLRFVGGPDGEGRTLEVSGVPDFSIGDREILFVAGNGTSLCPLVGWEQGRLRVVRGEVYDHFGREVFVTPSGRLAAGEPKLDLTALGYPETRVTPEHEHAGAHGECRNAIEPPLGSRRPDARGLADHVEFALLALDRDGRLAAVEPLPSADPSQPFRVEGLAPVAPPASLLAQKAAPLPPESAVTAAPSPATDAR
jgi:hypothetical protein